MNKTKYQNTARALSVQLWSEFTTLLDVDHDIIGGLHGGRGHLKIETWLRGERFESVMVISTLCDLTT